MHDLNTDICNYINKEWIAHWEGSIRSFAEEHDVDEKTIRQIADSKNTPYRISLYTLHKMCVARHLTLEDFFRLIKR
ncbi:hypothetical protein LWM68_34570 [Niabella sp. W65]|nr:hypothetical protein [Niabella sp. W65]MCH7367436.1 hypothetical protein [Niabella sp. W65]ULT43606.1 hypothetical protein KRR40_09395 [Niabella sp. I65]